MDADDTNVELHMKQIRKLSKLEKIKKAEKSHAFFISNAFFQLVGNKAKGRISKRVFQESKARKTNISYPLIRTCTCAYQGVRNVYFSEILACFAFLKHPF